MRGRLGSFRRVFAQQILHAVNAQAFTLCVWKQQASIAPLRLTEPGVQNDDSRLSQWSTPLLAAFADDPHMSAGSKDKVFAFDPRDLRQTQTRLDRHQDKRMIASPEPGVAVGGGEQSIDFRTREEADERARKALARDGQYTLDLRRVGRQFEGGVTKERMNSCQP